MKKILLAAGFSLLINTIIEAQLLKTLGDKAKAKIGQRANNKVDNAMDKGLDEVEGKNEKKVKEDEDGKVKIKTEEGDKVKIKGDNNSSLSYTSKYDFVPGEKVVAFEDFSNAAIGDFPTRWNTNATAEVVTLNNREGKWLKINKEGVWHPEFVTNLPENFTLEFDLGVSEGFAGSPFVLNIANLKNKEQGYKDFYHGVNWGRHGHAIHMQFKPSTNVPAWSRLQASADGNYSVDNNNEFKNWDNSKNNFAHVSLWRQNQRLRVYVNGEKIFDVPKTFEAGGKYNTITFAMQGSFKPEEYQYFLGNIRLAIGAADTRNKLITEGKFVTRGILFDVNSDKIKPESYGAIKDIGNVLKENADVKVKIVGHTDADGDDAKNLDLSKRRAASVKTYLVKEFSVSADNLETDGKGETQPVDKNTTAEGKANNRRVEFIKL